MIFILLVNFLLSEEDFQALYKESLQKKLEALICLCKDILRLRHPGNRNDPALQILIKIFLLLGTKRLQGKGVFSVLTIAP